MVSKRIEVLSQRLIGYNRKQVDEYIEEISITHQKTVNFLKDNIENHRMEKERLLGELSVLKSFNQGGEKSKELLELALKRAVKTIALINKMSEEDVENIMEEAKNKVLLHEKEAQDLERDMEAQRTEIDQLLYKVQLVFQEKVKDLHQPESHEKTEEKNAHKIQVTAHKSKNINATLERILTNNDWHKAMKQLNKGKVDKILLDKPENIAAESERMTADGFSLPHLKKFNEKKGPGDALAKQEKKLKKEGMADTFWEDWNEPAAKNDAVSYRLNNVVKLPEEIFTREEKVLQDAVSSVLPSSDQKEEQVAAQEEEQIISDGKDNQKTFEAATNKPFNESYKGSSSVNQEIEKIREKYIVGKIAGNDLLDQNGKVIIAKHGVISSEVVKAAEREGKLAELIVNMSLSDLIEE